MEARGPEGHALHCVIDALIREVAELRRVTDAAIGSEGDNEQLAAENARLRATVKERDEALRPFAREHTHAEIAPRAAFARAAELVPQGDA
jgi:hypothetical protein